MKKKIPNISVYITNVCNLNCDDCIYLNNYAFSGHQRWNDYKEIYSQWAQRLDIGIIHMLGGEPMANPDFLDWVHGIANLWPLAVIKINTNGTMLERWPTLYQELLPYQGRVYVAISGHNPDEKQNQLDTITKFLQEPVKIFSGKSRMFESYIWNRCYQEFKDPSWPECTTLDDYNNLSAQIRDEIENILNVDVTSYVVPPEPFEGGITMIDKNNIRFSWSQWWEFTPSAVTHDQENGILTLNNNDPVRALEVCSIKTCHQLSYGKLYKCPISHTLPSFIQQFPVDISDSDKEIILSYQPAEADWSDDDLDAFIDNLVNKRVIDMCKFCSVETSAKTVYASNKKIKIKKISSQ